MPALDGEAVVGAGVLHPHPGQGRGSFVDRLGQPPGKRGAVHRTGNLAALAGDAALRIHQDRFHGSPRGAPSSADTGIGCRVLYHFPASVTISNRGISYEVDIRVAE
ncbi:MAG: hypothetical protein HYU33_05305 [Candidatus Omnitrophica bacterium]|nr:hypothetical protein [Candidatus Omnitrophota bacterium]